MLSGKLFSYVTYVAYFSQCQTSCIQVGPITSTPAVSCIILAIVSNIIMKFTE